LRGRSGRTRLSGGRKWGAGCRHQREDQEPNEETSAHECFLEMHTPQFLFGRTRRRKDWRVTSNRLDIAIVGQVRAS
jgi:hypothetical protein